MKLYYFDGLPNFGDALNGWLWERLLPGLIDEDPDTRFSGIGTIIRATMPPARRWIVFTSGAGYGALPAGFGGPGWEIVAVRGPLTARALGLPADRGLADGALLLAALDDHPPLPEAERQGVVFVPHHDAEALVDWATIAGLAGVEYLSPLTESRAVVQRLRRARLVLADAMHAAIIADALRVPWVPVVTGSHINTFKWLDWTGSMGVRYEPARIPGGSLALALQSAVADALGDGHQLGPGVDPVTAFAARPQSGRYARTSRRIARKFGLGLVKAVRSEPVASLLAGRDRRQHEQAAAALAALARRPGYLSAEPRHGARLAALVDRLATVRRLAGG